MRLTPAEKQIQLRHSPAAIARRALAAAEEQRYPRVAVGGRLVEGREQWQALVRDHPDHTLRAAVNLAHRQPPGSATTALEFDGQVGAAPAPAGRASVSLDLRDPWERPELQQRKVSE